MSEVRFSPSRVTRRLLQAVVLLVSAHVIGQVAWHVYGHNWLLGLVPAFDLNAEMNIPTWFAGAALLAASTLAAIAAAGARIQRRGTAVFWAGLSLLLMLGSVDELIAVHERWVVPLREQFNLSGPFWFAWIIPAALGLAVLAAAAAPSAARLDATTRRHLLAAGAVYVGGALGMEAVGGLFVSPGRMTPGILVATTIEETLELLGLVMLLRALLLHLSRYDLHVSIARDRIHPVAPLTARRRASSLTRS